MQLDAPRLRPLNISADTDFDLVILTYQVWYLSPALPMTAFLQSEAGRQLIKGRPVVTLVACRNMWLSAQETMKHLISDAGGHLIDHLAFVDQGHPLATFITTPRWVWTGKRDSFLDCRRREYHPTTSAMPVVLATHWPTDWHVTWKDPASQC